MTIDELIEALQLVKGLARGWPDDLEDHLWVMDFSDGRAPLLALNYDIEPDEEMAGKLAMMGVYEVKSEFGDPVWAFNNIISE